MRERLVRLGLSVTLVAGGLSAPFAHTHPAGHEHAAPLHDADPAHHASANHNQRGPHWHVVTPAAPSDTARVDRARHPHATIRLASLAVEPQLTTPDVPFGYLEGRVVDPGLRRRTPDPRVAVPGPDPPPATALAARAPPTLAT